jgi:hypothetical protein
MMIFPMDRPRRLHLLIIVAHLLKGTNLCMPMSPNLANRSRNFTAYQNRFRMPGAETGGVGNMWYSFDYGLVHFVSFDARDLSGGETRPKENETYVTDSGPFGTVGNYSDTKTYEQYQWLAKDLASVDRTKTPWVLAMTHRPMYSSQTSSYQKYLRNAFEALLLENEVDAYLSG